MNVADIQKALNEASKRDSRGVHTIIMVKKEKGEEEQEKETLCNSLILIS